MIKVDRLPAPDVLSSDRAHRLLARMVEHYALAERSRGSRAYSFDRSYATILGECRKPLYEQFSGKCAYCESSLDISGGDVDHFRPRAGVAESSGHFLGDHYWAQALEWENLYYACRACNRYKASRFPVAGERGPADGNLAQLSMEFPMLLDPCSDSPEAHLAFTADGLVSGISERGRVTIEILALNRSELVEQRKLAAIEFMRAREKSEALTEYLLGEHQPFLALKRQLYATGGKATPAAKAAHAAQRKFDRDRERVDVEHKDGLDHYRARARHITRVQISNVGTIEKLTLDLSKSDASSTPCFALLGSNGAGKSTALKAISLALAGSDYAARIGLKARDLLRDGASEGSVLIWISGYQKPVELTLKRGSAIRSSEGGTRMLTLAYGSSRLLPTKRHGPRAGMPHAKIDNLFDPFLPLSDAREWLTGTAPERFQDVAETLSRLLQGNEKMTIERVFDGKSPRRGRVVVRLGGHEIRDFDELSDGLQSMLGLCADIMEIMFAQGFQSMSAAQGTVLIDELGNHLHPSWRMQIVTSLRQAFPRIQFIYSTHDPLCLRGLKDGEVAVLRRDKNRRIYAMDDLPSIAGMRVDQLLTSEHFGMDSTVDPETEELQERYRELMLDPDRTPDLEAEFDAIKQKMTELRLLGSNERERMLLKLIDEQLARPVEIDAGQVSYESLTDDAVNKIKELMRNISPASSEFIVLRNDPLSGVAPREGDPA